LVRSTFPSPAALRDSRSSTAPAHRYSPGGLTPEPRHSRRCPSMVRAVLWSTGALPPPCLRTLPLGPAPQPRGERKQSVAGAARCHEPEPALAAAGPQRRGRRPFPGGGVRARPGAAERPHVPPPLG
jgi:hypothetical protein